jgi:hypothetical protein
VNSTGAIYIVSTADDSGPALHPAEIGKAERTSHAFSESGRICSTKKDILVDYFLFAMLCLLVEYQSENQEY